MSYKHKKHIELSLGILEGEEIAELNEVYAKAEAFDDIKERFDSYKVGVKKDYDKDMTGTNLHMLLVGGAVLNHFDEFNVESEAE